MKDLKEQLHKPNTNHDHENVIHSDHDGHNHSATEDAGWKSHWQLLLAVFILFVMLTLEFGFEYILAFPINFIVFATAYLLAILNAVRIQKMDL